MSPWTKLLTALGLCSVSVTGFAQSSSTPDYNFNWGGFITQGWTKTSANNFYGESAQTDGSFDFREIGLYGSYEANSELRISGQLLSRKAGETQDDGIVVDHLLADWSFMQTPDLQAGVRLGRIKNNIGFYNNTREIAFTRPSALLPQSIYLDRIREIALSSDGIDGYIRKDTNHGYLSFDVQFGAPQADENSEWALLGNDWDGEFNDADVMVMRLLYESPLNDWRFAVTKIDSSLPFDVGAGDTAFLSDPTSEVDFSAYTLSAQWNSEFWSITTEYMYETTTRNGFGNFFQPKENDTELYYIQFDTRLSPELSTFVRYDVVYVDTEDRNGETFAARTGRPAFQRYAKDWTVGLGYQPNKDWLLRAEWHHVEGTAWLSVLDNPVTSDTEKHWNMLLLQASYRF